MGMTQRLCPVCKKRRPYRGSEPKRRGSWVEWIKIVGVSVCGWCVKHGRITSDGTLPATSPDMKCIGFRDTNGEHIDCGNKATMGRIYYGHVGNMCADCNKVHDERTHDREPSKAPWEVVEPPDVK